MKLSGKTALITGGSSGMGERFAHTLSNAGAKVILVARRIDKLKEIAKQLPNAEVFQMDVSYKSSVEEIFKEIERQKDKIDICINCAGIVRETPIFDNQVNNNFEDIIQTNLIGLWYVTKSVAMHMKSHSIHGSIINIASALGFNLSEKNLAGYSASKAGVIQLTKALVGELSEHNIRINSISPGAIITPMSLSHYSEEDIKELPNQIPVKFIGEISDLEEIILLLSCNQSSRYITGSNFVIDGGISWGD